MAKYDDASWHYGGEFPKDLENKNGATHIGMFIAWCIHNDLVSEFQLEESGEDVQEVKNKSLTGAEFLINNCDEKFIDEDLSEIGNEFASAYYEDDTEFGKKFGSYINDYQLTFQQFYAGKNIELESFYHIEDSWDNYEIIKPVIDKRFQDWKVFTNNQ